MYSDEEYEYLESEYQSWTTRHECKTKAQEEIFKGLCIAQLTIRRARQNGTNKEFTDAIKTFQDLLGAANLKPSQTNDNALVEQNTFGTLIRRIENERPIREALPEWKDVDDIERYIDTYFLGHMAISFFPKRYFPSPKRIEPSALLPSQHVLTISPLSVEEIQTSI